MGEAGRCTFSTGSRQSFQVSDLHSRGFGDRCTDILARDNKRGLEDFVYPTLDGDQVALFYIDMGVNFRLRNVCRANAPLICIS